MKVKIKVWIIMKSNGELIAVTNRQKQREMLRQKTAIDSQRLIIKVDLSKTAYPKLRDALKDAIAVFQRYCEKYESLESSVWNDMHEALAQSDRELVQ